MVNGDKEAASRYFFRSQWYELGHLLQVLESLKLATFNVSTKFILAFTHVALKDPESHGVETKAYPCIHDCRVSR